MATTKKLLQAASGTAYGSGAGGLNVEDVFSTYLYDGTGSAQTITNGIDLSGEGGMVWIKGRETTENHVVADTERGAGSTSLNDAMFTNLSNGATSNDNYVTAFNSDGFDIGTRSEVSSSTYTFASWTFRKAPKFFDVVTYTGDGTSGKTISHNLGGTVGWLLIKRTDSTGNWIVYHRSLGTTGGYPDYLLLESSAASSSGSSFLIHSVSDTSFVVGSGTGVNASGGTYVAYLFAHNNSDGDFGPTGDQDIIKCGSYTGNGSTTGPEIDLGWEPQWLLVKRSDTAGPNWNIYDNMRGVATNVVDAELTANLTNAESSANDRLSFTSTGFKLDTSHGSVNGPGDYIYIAIRRGPMAVPTAATEVFDIYQNQSTATVPAFQHPFPVDFGVYKATANVEDWWSSARLIQDRTLRLNLANAETSSGAYDFDYMDGWLTSTTTQTDYYSWAWRRAPHFFDVVCYDGNQTAGRTVNHNLGVVPEMMWVKCRENNFTKGSQGAWQVYHKGLNGGTNPEQYVLGLDQTTGQVDDNEVWNDTAPTSTNFTVHATNVVNLNTYSYIAYLFASLDGVSKVGSYTGDGTSDGSKVIDCGFSSGARFVLIKNADATSHWLLYDSERGIVTGNDPALRLNLDSAQTTSYDDIDPYSAGFTVNNVAAGYQLNNTGENYIFYAIA